MSDPIRGRKCRFRRAMTLGVLALFAGVLAGGQDPALDAARRTHILEPFDYRGVTLDDGMMRREFDEVRDFYLRIPNDDLLKGFRQRAGLPAPGVDLGGWYTADIGNIFGQVMSGLARMFSATGDPRCLAKVNAMVTEWGKCIGPDGYPFFSTHPAGIAYIFDKLVGGLVDAILYCRNREAAGYLARITDWAERNINRVRDYANADGAGAPRVAWSEWYTLGENLDRAYLATGDKRYKDFAAVWEYADYWNIYAGRGDIFAPRADGQTTKDYHAYSHVNTLSSAGAAYEVTGKRRYLDTLKNAFDYLQANQCFATGGFGPDEALVPRQDLLRRLAATHNTFETQCGSWAGFKASRYLILFTGDARYGDWTERLLWNGIGASLPNAADGRVFYYSDYNPGGAKKILYDSGWSCCSGSRPMAVAAFHDLIYFYDRENLFVNLFAPSTVTWNGVTVRQRTRFPEEATSEFTVETEAPKSFGLNLRAPGWLAGPMTVQVNGHPAEAKVNDRHWVTVHREWRHGDRITVRLPMAFRAEALDAKGTPAAICFGPVVMAVRSPAGNPASRIALLRLGEELVPSPGEPLTFHLRGDANILVRPFYAFKENEPYFLYLDPSAVSGIVTSVQYGASREDFEVGPNHNRGFVILPPGRAADGTRPWVWYAPTFVQPKDGLPDPSHAWLFERLLAKGFAIAGVDVGESYGSPAGRADYSGFYDAVTAHYRLSAKACLLPQSRGGLMLYNWAAEHPDRVQCIGGIYTVCDPSSWPGLAVSCSAYGMTEQELRTHLSEHNPIERLRPLAMARIPILHLHGDVDTLVPLERNSGELVRRYRKLGGAARLIVIKGKGHEVCDEFFRNHDLLEFFLRLGKS